MGNEEWQKLLHSVADNDLSIEERRIATALAEGKSTSEIAREMGQHRSMIWRKAQRVRARIAAKAAEPTD